MSFFALRNVQHKPHPSYPPLTCALDRFLGRVFRTCGLLCILVAFFAVSVDVSISSPRVTSCLLTLRPDFAKKSEVCPSPLLNKAHGCIGVEGLWGGEVYIGEACVCGVSLFRFSVDEILMSQATKQILEYFEVLFCVVLLPRIHIKDKR